MANVRRPRHSSLQFWPRKKSQRPYAQIKAWANEKNIALLGFAGYKAGMTHIALKDNRPWSHTKGDEIVWPVTVIECPALKLYSIRFYKRDTYGLKLVKEILNPKLDRELERKLSMPKKQKATLNEAENKTEEYADIRVNVYTQPKKSGLGKKTPELFELGIGGSDIKSKLEYAKKLLDKEIKINEVMKQGIKIDVHSVTKGKGFQGVVKRHGAQLKAHKAEKKRRGVVYGPLRPRKILWGVPSSGRMGYNLRTEYSKDLILIDTNPEKINPKGGFLHYGLVKGDYVIIKGSVPGPAKRLITFTNSIRNSKPLGNQVELTYISIESKQ